jgi:hypothetical protein
MSRRANIRKRLRQRKKHMIPKSQKPAGPRSRGLIVPTPSPVGIMRLAIAEMNR